MEHQKQIIHFCHIPKTGGKSFRRGLMEAYGNRVCFLNPTPLRLNSWEKFLFRLLQIKNFIKPKRSINDYDIVFGHYCFDFLYSSHKRPIKRGAFFRDPVEWVGSLYFFYLKKTKKDRSKIDILKFIKSHNLKKGYRKHLGSFSVESLDFVGITERYQESLNLYNKKFGVSIKLYHVFKTKIIGTSYKEYFIEQGVYEEVANLMKDNKKIYNEAMDHFTKLQQG